MNRKKNNQSEYFQMVYRLVRMIPPGRVTSYGAIARFLGDPRGARVVGWAMNDAHYQSEYVPAHRVVNRVGMLTGKHHFGSSEAMKELLESEGIYVLNDCIQDFKSRFWDPLKELDQDAFF